MTPVFAFLDDAKDALTELVTGLLMVAGGFLVGYILGGIVAWGVGRYVFKQKDNDILKRLGRPIGGVVLALIVAIIVFTGKGKPHGEGGDGKGTPDDTAGKNAPAKADPKPPDPHLKKPPEVTPSDLILQVTVYAGAGAQGDRCYQLGDAKSLVNFADLTKEILARKAEVKGKVSVAILYPDNPDHVPGNPPGQLHQNVARVVQWATSDAKMGVMLPPASK
jgi:hypothetical protein